MSNVYINKRVQYLVGICASLGFLFTGSVSSWPSPAIPKFKSGEAKLVINDAQTSWVVSLVPLGALPGCMVGQALGERIGRRRAILSMSVPGVLGASIIMFSTIPWLVCVARALVGMSTGITAVVTIVYLSEIADKEIRGTLGMLCQVMNYSGGLIMYSVGPFVSYATLNTIVLTIPIVYVLVCLWIPESPYYHLKDDRFAEAKKEFVKLNESKDQKWVEEQLAVIKAHVRQSMENKTTFKELLTNKIYRKALYIIAGLKVLQYMTGILAIQTYLEMIFIQSSSISGANASIIYGVVQLLAGVGATFIVGYFGRRVLMIVSCSGVGLSLTAVGTYFFLQDSIKLSPETMSTISALPLMGIIGFVIFYSIGIGNLPYIMQAELFPINVKTVASSTATSMSCIFSFSVAKCYQSIKDVFGHYTVFWFFALVAYVGILFVYVFVPETFNKTLEEVQDNIIDKPVEMNALRDGDSESEMQVY